MDQISATRQQLEQAGYLPQVLTSSLEAFDLLSAACHDGQDGFRELFAAFAFAANAATEARIAIARAPSLPDPDPAETGRAQSVLPDLNETDVDALADLAALLHARLSDAGRRAKDAGDQDACAEAAQQAHLISKLLAPGPRPDHGHARRPAPGSNRIPDRGHPALLPSTKSGPPRISDLRDGSRRWRPAALPGRRNHRQRYPALPERRHRYRLRLHPCRGSVTDGGRAPDHYRERLQAPHDQPR
jgi:hypothetical protein